MENTAIEMWGRGISLILESCSKAHLNPPKIYEDHGFIYTVFTSARSLCTSYSIISM